MNSFNLYSGLEKFSTTWNLSWNGWTRVSLCEFACCVTLCSLCCLVLTLDINPCEYYNTVWLVLLLLWQYCPGRHHPGALTICFSWLCLVGTSRDVLNNHGHHTSNEVHDKLNNKSIMVCSCMKFSSMQLETTNCIQHRSFMRYPELM